MRQPSSSATEPRCQANHHNLVRDTPELDDDTRRRRLRGPPPPPSAVRPAGDDRAVALQSHAGYVALSWEKALKSNSWERTPTDGLDARKERRAIDTSVDLYWWTEDGNEPTKMTVRTHGHGTFLPSTYAAQLNRLMPAESTPLDVYGAYDVRKREWTQTELPQKIPPQRVLFLRSKDVRRTPGLEERLASAFPSLPATPITARTASPSLSFDREATLGESWTTPSTPRRRPSTPWFPQAEKHPDDLLHVLPGPETPSPALLDPSLSVLSYQTRTRR
ncbi:hypothetical protein HDZ31DRAFT_70830 [Schizophyllum fasciatum]